jgi:hypothetical protein
MADVATRQEDVINNSENFDLFHYLKFISVAILSAF